MKKLTINAIEDVCPIPLVKAQKAAKELGSEGGTIEISVGNVSASENLLKMAGQKGWKAECEKEADGVFKVTLQIAAGTAVSEEIKEEEITCETFIGEAPAAKKRKQLVVISADHMGEGAEELGKLLIKGFCYALTQQETVPDVVLLYNSGIFLACRDSVTADDLIALQEKGSKIYCCGTCVDFYGKKDEIKVGEITNMYEIVRMMEEADRIIRP